MAGRRSWCRCQAIPRIGGAGEQVQTELSQVRADQARTEAERDTLRAAMQVQTKDLTAASAERERMAGELAKLTARIETPQVLLTDYRTRLGLANQAG